MSWKTQLFAAGFLVTTLTMTAGNTIIDSNFGDAGTYKEIPKKDFVSGSLPDGWKDESVYSKSNCVYSYQQENSTGFFRIVCPGKGRIQFFHSLEPFDTRKAFKISIKAKSPSKANLKFLIQAMGTSRSFAVADIQLSDAWKDYSTILGGGPTDVKNVGLILTSPGPCTVEIANLKFEEIPLAEYVPSTMVPVMRNDSWWLPRHQRMVKDMVKVQPEFVIMGDSITGAWEAQGKECWAKNFAPLKSCAFGNGGDRVEHLLWRVKNSGLGKDFQPKVIAILIGVNNLFSADPVDIAAGTENLIREIHKMSPKTKILLLGVFPVGEKANDIRRNMIKNVNAQYEKLADNKNVFYLDFGQVFLEPDGSISKDILFDYVHCTPKGYDRYTENLLPKVKELLGK